MVNEETNINWIPLINVDWKVKCYEDGNGDKMCDVNNIRFIMVEAVILLVVRW